VTCNFRIDIYVHICPCPPRGVTNLKAIQTKGKTMAADVQVSWTPDTDPNVQTTTTSFNVNGSVVGSTTLPAATAAANYLGLSPAPAALKVGDVVIVTNVSTDNLGQTSPIITAPTVTIQSAQPAPTGVTNLVAKQVGSP